jgi:hypothetical protein
VGGLLAVISLIVQSHKPAVYGKFARRHAPLAAGRPLAVAEIRACSDVKTQYSAGGDSASTSAALIAVRSSAPAEERGFNARCSFVLSDFLAVVGTQPLSSRLIARPDAALQVPVFAFVFLYFAERWGALDMAAPCLLDSACAGTGVNGLEPAAVVAFIAWETHFVHRGLLHPLLLRYSLRCAPPAFHFASAPMAHRNVGWDICVPMLPTNALFAFVNASQLATTRFGAFERDPRFVIGGQRDAA